VLRVPLLLSQDEWIIPPMMLPFVDQIVAWVRSLFARPIRE
jgi:CBS domain-containing protein